jgi:endoglucanase
LVLILATMIAGGSEAPAHAAGGDAADPRGTERIENGDFKAGSAGWHTWGTASIQVSAGQFCTLVPVGRTRPEDATIYQDGLRTDTSEVYTLTFEASASATVVIQAASPRLDGGFNFQKPFRVTPQRKTFTATFNSYNYHGEPTELAFWLGGASEKYTFCLHGVSVRGGQPLTPPKEHVVNGMFTRYTYPWWATDNLTLTATGGRLCTQVPGGTAHGSEAVVGYDGISLFTGDLYTVRFEVSASAARTIKTTVQAGKDDFGDVWDVRLSRDTVAIPESRYFTYTFTNVGFGFPGRLAFELGGSPTPWTFCLDNVSVVSEEAFDQRITSGQA